MKFHKIEIPENRENAKKYKCVCPDSLGNRKKVRLKFKKEIYPVKAVKEDDIRCLLCLD